MCHCRARVSADQIGGIVVTDDADVLSMRAARIASALEREWGEDLGESLADDEDAAKGFALARALTQGWIEPNEGLEEWFDAAEAILEEMGEKSDDDDDDA